MLVQCWFVVLRVELLNFLVFSLHNTLQTNTFIRHAVWNFKGMTFYVEASTNSLNMCLMQAKPAFIMQQMVSQSNILCRHRKLLRAYIIIWSVSFTNIPDLITCNTFHSVVSTMALINTYLIGNKLFKNSLEKNVYISEGSYTFSSQSLLSPLCSRSGPAVHLMRYMPTKLPVAMETNNCL